jgi:hypothetical protein
MMPIYEDEQEYEFHKQFIRAVQLAELAHKRQLKELEAAFKEELEDYRKTKGREDRDQTND